MTALFNQEIFELRLGEKFDENNHHEMKRLVGSIGQSRLDSGNLGWTF